MNFFKKSKFQLSSMVSIAPKTKQSLKCLGPKHQAYIEKTREKMKKSTTNNIFKLKDQGRQ